MQWLVKKIVGTKNDRDIKKLSPLVEEIKQIEEGLHSLTEEQLQAKTAEFRKRVADGESLDDILPEAFAVVKNACRRLKGKTFDICGNDQEWVEVHYDVQLLGGIALHKGTITEMATGEGKTLVATCPVYLNALSGRGVHVVTVNDYLARRDAEWMGTLYRYLGLTVGCIQSQMPPDQRREKYQCDITYGTNSEFGFDYLRDNMADDVSLCSQRGHFFAIIDEIDSILIDEARTPLIISGPSENSAEELYRDNKPAVERLVRKQQSLTTQLVDKLEKAIEEEADDDTCMSLIYQVHQSMPNNPRLLQMLEDPKVLRWLEAANLKMHGDVWKERARELREELYFTIDEKHQDASLTEKGCAAMSPNDPEAYVIPDMATFLAELDNVEISPEERNAQIQSMQALYTERSAQIHAVDQLIRAYVMYTIDNEYYVIDNKVIIIDKTTGRPMPGRRWSDGLHQAVEAKEGTNIERETITYATITIQNYFRLYEKLGGMTGTAETEADEFAEIYKLDVMVIPTNRPTRRIDYNDLIFRTQREKYEAVVSEIIECHKRGQPVLVGTISVESSEMLSRMLDSKKIIHNVLNAKKHEREAEVVSRAGQQGAVTIATNMAGRGTDIKLGKGVVQLPEGVLEGYQGLDDTIDGEKTFYEYLIDRPQGLMVLSTERNDSRRVDRQLRGRCSRQGDPGGSCFYVSLEDKLMRNFGSDKYAGVMEKLGYKEGDVLESKMLNKTIERAQRKVEQWHFSMRKKTLEYDDVMNRQREIVYGRRREILEAENPSEVILDFVIDEIHDQADAFYVDSNKESAMEDFAHWANGHFPIGIREEQLSVAGHDADAAAKVVKDLVIKAYERKCATEDPDVLPRLERFILLSAIDTNWREYLREADGLRDGINLMGHAQKDPLVEFKHRSYEMFQQLLGLIQSEVVNGMFAYSTSKEAMHTFHDSQARAVSGKEPKIQAHQPEPVSANSSATVEGGEEAMKAALQAPIKRDEPKVGRNDPCPCGSGKKYKRCHG